MTARVVLTRDGNIAHVAMDDGRGNALGTPMLEALLDAATRAADADAVLLTGRPKVFCGGLDLAEVVPNHRFAMERFLGLFHAACRAWLALERPVVMAAAGGAVAGGAVLLACGDRRLGARDNGVVGVNEVRLGIPFPASALECVRAALSSSQAHRALLFGELVGREEALAMGWFHALHPPDELLPRAWDAVRDAATIPATATAAVKRALRRDHLERMDALGPSSNAAFAAAWTGPEAQARLNKVLASIKRK
ncbi:MAG: hypothetical protein HY904_07105 [Deltaproteobacteria bacterium]|nr:hypothetical protein [Deltaproteobacteria bacterium]